MISQWAAQVVVASVLYSQLANHKARQETHLLMSSKQNNMYRT